jgi:hypothetical protein
LVAGDKTVLGDEIHGDKIVVLHVDFSLFGPPALRGRGNPKSPQNGLTGVIRQAYNCPTEEVYGRTHTPLLDRRYALAL